MSTYPNDARQAGNYTGGAVNVNDYTFMPGSCVLPLAEDPPENALGLSEWSPVVVLKLHAPYRLRRFTQVTGKDRNPAPISAPKDTGVFVLLGGTITLKPELSTTYNDYNWFVSCEYRFIENCATVDENGEPLGLVLGTIPLQTTIDASIEANGIAPIGPGAAAFGGRAVTSAYILGRLIVDQSGALHKDWSYNAQAFYPSTLFYSDLPNGGPPLQ